jgi:hypothetical protein
MKPEGAASCNRNHLAVLCLYSVNADCILFVSSEAVGCAIVAGFLAPR